MCVAKPSLMKLPLISVIIPSYQNTALLRFAAESVLCQQYPAIQLIICDDGTEGFDPAALQNELEGKLSGGCRVLHQTQNLGTVKNLNSGLREASGDWILLLAADDVLATPDVLTRLHDRAVRTQRGWIVSRAELCDEKMNPSGKLSPGEEELDCLCEWQTLFSRLCCKCFLPSSGTIYRADFLRQMGGFDERYQLVEDWPLFLRAARENHLPELCNFVSVRHRGGGVSKGSAARNQRYQLDLINGILTEVLPYLDLLPEGTRGQVRQDCQDKIDLYTFRFEVNGLMDKFRWLCTHPGLLKRKLL